MGVERGARDFLFERWQGEMREEELTPLQILLLGSLNVRCCSHDKAKWREEGKMLVKRMFDVFDVFGTKFK